MGRNERARAAGAICLTFALVLVLLAAFVYLISSPDGNQIWALVILSGMVIFNAYEAWAFTHGRTTSIDGWSTNAVPRNTGWRLFGLALDLVLLMLGLYWFFTKL